MQTLRLVILFLFPFFCTAQRFVNKSFTTLSDALQYKDSAERLIIKYPLQKDSISLIENLSFLQYLELSNQHEKIVIDFSKLSRLKKLILNSNFSALPESITKIEQVDSLILHHNDLTELPYWVCELKRLKSIGIAGNKIKQFPDCFFSLNNLENIDAGYNDITVFDEKLFSFPKLINLSIPGNKINILPEKPKLPSSIRIINFSDNETTWEKIKTFQKAIPKTVRMMHNEYKPPFFKGRFSECVDKDTVAGTIFTKCEVCPQYQGGDFRFRKFLNSHFDTTLIPGNKNFSDSVAVRFVVFKDGGISKITILESINNKLATETVRLIKESCAYWVPASFSGRFVNAWVTIKLYFNNKIIVNESDKTIWIKLIVP